MATMSMKQFEAKLKRWAKKNPTQVKNSLKKGTEIVRKEAVRKHLSGPKMSTGKGSSTRGTLARRSGDLAGSINTKVTVSTSKISGQVGTNLKYARIHEKGGVIKPVNAKALKFKIGNRWVVAKKVTIPARPFLSSSLEAKKNTVVSNILKDMIKGYNKS